jgi:hypothetical protein
MYLPRTSTTAHAFILWTMAAHHTNLYLIDIPNTQIDRQSASVDSFKANQPF